MGIHEIFIMYIDWFALEASKWRPEKNDAFLIIL